MHTIISPAILYRGTPVVLLTTENEDGTFNISPISSAWWLAHRCVLGLDASSKCTQNILRTKQVVLNLPSEDMVDNVNSIARTTGSNPMPPWKEAVGYTYVKDKFEAAGLTQQPSDFIHPPRILECPIQMEAEFVESNDIMSDLPDRKSIVLKMEVKILRTHVEESLRLNGHPNRIDTNKLRPLFMVFQEFHGMTRRISGKSRLAEVNEENYRLSTRSEVTKQLGDDDHLLSMVREDAVAPEGTAVELTHEQKESLRHLE